MSKDSNFAREIRAEGGGELASAAQQKSARFHGLPDSEMYTTEYSHCTPAQHSCTPHTGLSQTCLFDLKEFEGVGFSLLVSRITISVHKILLGKD